MQSIAVGDKIYIPHALHVFRGVDDVHGGLSTVTEVTTGISAGKTTTFVRVLARPETLYNWEILMAEQEELRTRFGQTDAFKDPDYSPEFNPSPNTGWRNNIPIRKH